VETEMKLGNTEKIFLTLISILLVCTPTALAEDQVEQQTGIFNMLVNGWNTLQFGGEVLLSGISYEIIHHTDADIDDDNITTQADLNYWNNLKAQYPFSEKPVFISLDNVFGLAYSYVPEGVSGVIIMDNSRNALDFYTVTKNETGLTVQKGAPSNPDHTFGITLHKLEKLDEASGNIEEVQAFKTYLGDQIQTQK
jgi:hypothetical protein